MATILVTGGAGFIGGHLAERFAHDGHDVRVIDDFVPYYDLGLKEHNVDSARLAAAESDGSYELIRGDIRNEEIVANALDGVDFVFHQAAQAGVRTSVEDPERVNSINVEGTLTVLEAARREDVTRVVNASSSSVYGKPEYLPYDEAHPSTPVSPYGVSKLAAEHYTRVYYELYGLPTVTLRYFTVYGPRMRPNMAISNFVSRCFNDESPVVYGDGSQTRDFTYIDDVIEANRTLLDSSAADGEVMNIGSTGTIEIRALAEVVRDILAPEVDIEFDERRKADAEHTHANVSKAKELIGFDPTTPIQDASEMFVDWYRQNRDGYEPLVRES